MPARKRRRAPARGRRRRPLKRRRFTRPFPGGRVVNAVTITKGNQASVPQSMNVKLKYCQMQHLLTQTASTQTFRVNSCYDPDFTGSGHQPMGFDQFSAFYSSYRVNAVRHNAHMVNNVSGSASAMMAAIYPDYSGTGNAINTNQMYEQPNVSHTFVSAAFGDSVKTISFYTTLANYFGLTKAEYEGDSDHQAAVGANPTAIALLNFQTETASEGNSGSDMSIMHELTLYVTFLEPKVLGLS